jgi:conjugative transfer protein TraD
MQDRRARTRRLIELGGLVQKSGLPEAASGKQLLGCGEHRAHMLLSRKRTIHRPIASITRSSDLRQHARQRK